MLPNVHYQRTAMKTFAQVRVDVGRIVAGQNQPALLQRRVTHSRPGLDADIEIRLVRRSTLPGGGRHRQGHANLSSSPLFSRRGRWQKMASVDASSRKLLLASS